jgi:amino acid adenylation domain-containing protein
MRDKNLESIYPLSPMQQGMLFHTLYQPEAGMYFEQFACTLRGQLDEAAFKRACQTVVERHPILRTAFVWESQSRPLQVVFRKVELPWTEADWRDVPAEAQPAQLAAFMQADREQGFELNKPPIMRMSLIRLSDDSWRFLWSHHHILLDGWSLPIVLREIFTCYEHFRRGEMIILPPMRPYKDYIGWLQQQDLTDAELFWRQALDGFTTPTALSEVVGRQPQGATPDYAEVRVALSSEATAGLQALAREHQLTLSTLMQGAWALLLSRYTGQSDVLFGATVSGRPPELLGVAEMVGLFINTLPLRVQVQPDQPLLDWLKQIQAHTVEMRQYEYSPLVQVQGWGAVKRGVPLFESLLVFENYPLDTTFENTQLSIAVRDVTTQEQTNYPLTVIGYPRATLELGFSYDTQRFAAETIKQLARQLQTLLENFQVNPSAALADIAILPAEERQRLLSDWNATALPYPRESCFHQLVESQAAETPDALAVLFAGQPALTYGELNQRANQLAAHLRSLGVGPETMVGLSIERSPEMLVALLGVLKAGGAYVPLDPTYPPERLAFILSDTQMPVLLTQQHLVAGLPEHQARVVCIDSDWETIARSPSTNLPTTATPDSLAYVIYTSGSTGKPKGVLVTHRGLTNMAEAQRQLFGAKPGDRILQFFSLNFDGATFEICLALRSGATLCLDTRENLLPGAGLLQRLRDWQVSIMVLTPSTLTILPVEELPSLRTMMVAGEACPPELVARWAGKYPFYNLYGPTETTIWATATSPLAPDTSTNPPIGRPIANMQAYVLPRHSRQLLPVGVPGELVVGGVGVARGYLNRPELTAEKFIDDPFSKAPGARLYRTGDLVRWLPDGTLEFLGRIDQQVKIRGFRIELGEIEAALSQHPAVREAAVVVQEEQAGDPRLVGYFVPAAKPPPSLRELRRFLKDWLPEYMVPANFMVLETLPLTANGKLDRRALPALGGGRPEPSATYVAPQTEVEQTIAKIWAEVLRLEKVGLNDNFFELGGHSLSMLQVHDKLKAALGQELAVAELFQYPTVKSLGQYLSQGRNSGRAMEQAQDRAQKQREALQRQKQLMQNRRPTHG